MGTYQDWTQTTTYNQSVLHYPAMGYYGEFEVPLLLTSYKIPTRAPKVEAVTSLPAIDSRTNLAYQGVALSAGSGETAKIQLQGHIDTPVANDGNGNMLPTLTRDSYHITYADLIAMCLEGRYTQGNVFQRVDPMWFRDPFGRQFNQPYVIQFTANYVEAVPGRTDFTMALRI